MNDLIWTGPWSEQLAGEVEGILSLLVNKIEVVEQPIGESSGRHRDFKIGFRVSSRPPTQSFFLAYDPETQVLRAWTRGLGYKSADEVVDFISRQFSHAVYRAEPGLAPDGVHAWIGITPRQIRQKSQ